MSSHAMRQASRIPAKLSFTDLAHIVRARFLLAGRGDADKFGLFPQLFDGMRARHSSTRNAAHRHW